MTDLEKRVHNTENALVALWALIQNTIPAENKDHIENMMEEYFNANTDLGATFGLNNGFDRKGM